MAANKTFKTELRADRYMLSNDLMVAAANNNRQSTPGLPAETGLFLLRAVLKHKLAVWNTGRAHFSHWRLAHGARQAKSICRHG